MSETQVENKPEAVLQQPEVVTNSSQTKSDINSSQIQSEQETEQQINWKKFKEARAKERAESELLAKKASEKEAEAAALKAALEAVVNRPNNNSIDNSKSNDQYEDMSEEQRIEMKVQAALEKAERKRYEEQQRREQEEIPQRLVKNNPDFNQICSQENLDYLDYHYPEISRAFQQVPNSIQKWEDIYRAVKRFVPNTNSNREAAKAESNLVKPKSISSPGTTNTAQAMPAPILTEERKRSNWERMQKIKNSLE